MYGGKRFNAGKPIVSAVVPCFTKGIADVLTFGQGKYGRNNWMGGLSFEETLDSLERHLLRLKQGEDFDEESGIRNIYHIGCNAMFLAHFLENYDAYESFDDRAYTPAGLGRFGPQCGADSGGGDRPDVGGCVPLSLWTGPTGGKGA